MNDKDINLTDKNTDLKNKTTVQLNSFMLEHLKINLPQSISKTDYTFNLLNNCSTKSKCFDDKSILTLYFTDEQNEKVAEKLKELGFKTLSEFTRCVLFNDYLRKTDVSIGTQTMKSKTISVIKFKTLMKKCKNELIKGDYTSYNINKLRNNAEFGDKILKESFESELRRMNGKFNFIEYDMLSFVADEYRKHKVYDELIGKSTNQCSSKSFTVVGNYDIVIEPFTDYDNIVPDINTTFYLWLYYIFKEHEVFKTREVKLNTDEKHAEKLLEMYTYSKVMNYMKQKNIFNNNEIFDDECINYLKLNNFIEM